MPKVSVYLPDDLYRAARDQGLSISAVTQRALEVELRGAQTDRWIAAVRGREPRVRGTVDTCAALDAARSDFGA